MKVLLPDAVHDNLSVLCARLACVCVCRLGESRKKEKKKATESFMASHYTAKLGKGFYINFYRI